MVAETTQERARKALEDAIEAYVDVIREDPDCDDVIGVDAVLLVGAQWIDDDGDRGGNVTILPRNGSQPPYITIGLLELAKERIVSRTVNETSA